MYDLVADRPESLTVTSPGGPGAPGHTEPVVTAASYLPGGPLTGLALGSGTRRPAPSTAATHRRRSASPATRRASATTPGATPPTRSATSSRSSSGPSARDAPKVLTPQTVTTTETFTSCSDLAAGGGFTVDSPGNVTFEAQGTVILADGFSVLSGATFTAGSAGAPELSRRTFGYQDVQYFLTGAAGPWPENLDWTYDQIGNRLTETRTPPNGVPVTDTYQYLANDATGNSPVLDQVTLGMGGTRNYTWDPAGNLDQVAANANVIDFAFDDESRLASAGRAVADVSSDFLYDGRSFLRSAVELQGDPPAEAASVRPLYSSDGLLQALRRKAAPADPEELVIFLYFAGRPVAQLAIDGTGTETWTYLTTDHLGTPLLATDDTRAVVWEGGLEPFGSDWQANTMAGALDTAIYLRLPGQWDDGTWDDATSGSGVNYNVHRWFQPATGTYTRSDPAGLVFGGLNPYRYADGSPLRFSDPLGLTTCVLISGVKMAELGGVEAFFGDHAGVYIAGPCSGGGPDCSSPAPMLYDPNGGYPQLFPDSGQSYILDEDIEEWSFGDYFDYQCNAGSDILELYCFNTTCCEEQAIEDRIGAGGTTAFGCSLMTTGAVNGVGPFGALGSGLTPALLRRALNRALRNTHGGGITRHRCPTERQ